MKIILLLGIIVTAAVWFVTSNDHLLQYVENDLSTRVDQVLSEEGYEQVGYSVAGRDVVLHLGDETSVDTVRQLRARVANIPGVGRSLAISSISGESDIAQAVAALSQTDSFSLLAEFRYDGKSLTAVGNGTAGSATKDLFDSLAASRGISINDYLRYDDHQLSSVWPAIVQTWTNALPGAGPGWLLITENNVALAMDDPASAVTLGKAVEELALEIPVNYRQLQASAVVNATSAQPALADCNVALNSIVSSSAISFKHESEELSTASVSTLAKVRELADGCQPSTLAVRGHTDSLGPSQFNLDLSLRRANVVRNELLKLGVPAQDILAEGFGESQPIDDNETRPGRARNRRIELEFVEK